jgi:hypothetical protein
MYFDILNTARPWFLDIFSSILAPNSSPALTEIIIACFPNLFFNSAPSRIPEAIMHALDAALSARPSRPSIKWQLECTETEFNDFVASVQSGMPRMNENGRLVFDTYVYHSGLSRIDGLPYTV